MTKLDLKTAADEFVMDAEDADIEKFEENGIEYVEKNNPI